MPHFSLLSLLSGMIALGGLAGAGYVVRRVRKEKEGQSRVLLPAMIGMVGFLLFLLSTAPR